MFVLLNPFMVFVKLACELVQVVSYAEYLHIFIMRNYEKHNKIYTSSTSLERKWNIAGYKCSIITLRKLKNQSPVLIL